MKFVEPHPFTNPDAAARKLVEIANGVEAVQDGRIYIERVNELFLAAGGSGDQFRAGIERGVTLGWLWRHESGTHPKFTGQTCGAVCLKRRECPQEHTTSYSQPNVQMLAQSASELVLGFAIPGQ
jgi:hypothetical protein